MNGLDLMEAARLRVWNRHPYIGAVLMSLRLVEKPIGTLAVDAGWRCYYDPKKCEEWGVEMLAGVVAHEVWHILRDHFVRCGERDPQIWNLANDCEINSDITKAGWKLPEGGGLMPAKFGLPEGQLAEEYYDKIIDKVTKVVIKMQGPGNGQCGSCSGHAHECEDGNGEGSPDKDGKDGKGKGNGDVPAPISSWEQEVIRRQAAQEIAQAAKGQGNVPAGLAAWAEKELAPPTIDWRKQLASLVRKTVTAASGAVDHTWRKQSRRGAGLRLRMGSNAPIMPALFRPIPNIGLVLDVSGSMCGGPAEAARGEIMGVVKAIGCPIEVYVADTQVAGKKRVGSVKDIAALGETLGGTDMANAIMEVDKMAKHDILIVLTDGFTGWHNPGSVRSRVLAAITPGGSNPPTHVPHVTMVG